MVQRAGRIDRIGSKHPLLWVYNMFPEEGLEKLLRLVESLNRKITDIDRSGFLDVSVLGETVHPRNFNTLRRILDEDGSVIEEQEQFAELASNEFLLHQLQSLLDTGAREMLEELPDGIHSGLAQAGGRGLFFYFTAPGGTRRRAATLLALLRHESRPGTRQPVPHRKPHLMRARHSESRGRL